MDISVASISSLGTANNATMNNTGVQLSLQDSGFSYFEFICRCGNAESYGNAGSHGNLAFNFLRDLHNVFMIAAAFYIPTNSTKELQFPYTLI